VRQNESRGPTHHVVKSRSCAGYVGLTFDDAPTGNTQSLIDALRSAGLRATMFNIGQRAQSNPALVRAQLDAGLWIGNHTFTHPHLPTLTEAQIRTQLQQTQNVVQQVAGTAPRLFRPPYGETNETIRSVAQQLGLIEVLWDIDSEDWRGVTTAKIVEAASYLEKGMTILMHDLPATTAAIPQIAADLAARRLCAGMISPTTGRPVAPTSPQ
jgi:peptidoglycan/xylan/chitin deacetylase (PgdA/CDA1 family)